MRIVSPPPPPPAALKQQQQQQLRHVVSLERLPEFNAPSEVFRVRRPSESNSVTSTTSTTSTSTSTSQPQRTSPSPSFDKVLVIPGNPGSGSFYAHFAEELARELGPGTEVAALSFYGHETTTAAAAAAAAAANDAAEGKASRQPLCLDGQVEHASAFLEKLLDEAEEEAEKETSGGGGGGGRLRRRPPSVAVVGHSIGGTVAALAVKEVEEKRRRRQKSRDSSSSSPSISAVCAMMPYVAFDETSSQQRALRALATNGLARGAACLAARGLGRLLPRRALASLVAAATARSPLAPRARETVADFVAADGLRHALYLASTEFDALAVVVTGDESGGGSGSGRGNADGSGGGGGSGAAGENGDAGKKKAARKFRVGGPSSIWSPLAALGPRASVFAAADGDHWCPRHHLDLLREQAPQARLFVDGAQRHDFVVCDERSSRAARDVARLLRESARAHAAAVAED